MTFSRSLLDLGASWWNDFVQWLKTKFLVSIFLTHEIRELIMIRIIVSKVQIQEESGKILRYIKILIKLDNELAWENREIDIFRNKTPRWIHGIKNHSIWISIHGEIKKWNKEKKIDREERKWQFYKLKLIFWSKLKSNGIRWKIMRKTP